MRIDRLIDAARGADDEPEVVRFPPVLDRPDTSNAAATSTSFPHLAGTVHSFAGDERAHRELLRAVESGADWSAQFPADRRGAHARGVLSGRIRCSRDGCRAAGRLVDVMSYCFRHEPSEDAGRMQMFRMHEYVRAGEPETVLAWRTRGSSAPSGSWTRSASSARTDVASDPFFGRGGETAGGQPARSAAQARDPGARRQTTAAPTAIISLNYHQDHFGRALRHRRRTTATTGPHGVCRIRPGAAGARALSPPRIRPRAMVRRRARGARAVIARLWTSDPRRTPACRSTSASAPGRSRTATSTSGSNCCMPRGLEPIAALPVHARDRLRRRPVDVLQVSARRLARVVRHRHHRAQRLAAAARTSRGAAGNGAPADRRSRCASTSPIRPARRIARSTSRRRSRFGDRRDARRLGYFHNAGSYELTGEDFTGLFNLEQSHPSRLPPYVEIVKRATRPPCRGRTLVDESIRLLCHHVAHRPATNPFLRYADRLPGDLDWLAAGTLRDFHGYAFATFRQFGAAFELAAAYLRWLERHGELELDARRGRLRRHRHHSQGAAVQGRARVVRRDGGSTRTRCSRRWRRPGTTP